MAAKHVLVLGAGGFIGSHLVAELVGRGYRVTAAGRDPDRLARLFPSCVTIPADLERDGADAWVRRLAGIDAVVNTAGILRGAVDQVHAGGAVALFDACARAGVPNVLQISALGSGQQAQSRFLASKAVADEHLLALAARDGRARWHVVRPSLVIGRGGASTALFCALAAGPFPLRLGPGNWQVQPVHVTDLTDILVALLDDAEAPPVVTVAGPAAMTTDGLTSALRRWLGLPAARPVALPASLLRMLARIGTVLPEATLTTETLGLLEAGNVADDLPAITTGATRPLAGALAADPSQPADRLQARMAPVKPLLLGSLVALWIGTGVVSLLITTAQAERLLAGLGLSGPSALGIAWAGALLDLVLGVGLLWRRWRCRVIALQIGIVLVYTVLATIALPGLWLDPLGPILKNLPILAASLALLVLER